MGILIHGHSFAMGKRFLHWQSWHFHAEPHLSVEHCTVEPVRLPEPWQILLGWGWRGEKGEGGLFIVQMAWQ